MNICMFILRYYPYPEGGAERQCRKLIKEFEKRGNTCSVVTAWDFGVRPKRDRDGATDIHRFGIMGLFKKKPKENRVSGNHQQQGVSNAGKSLVKRIRFWFVYSLIWFHRLFLLIEVILHITRHKRSIDVIHIHEAQWFAGFGFWLGHLFNIPAVCKEAILPVRVGLRSSVVPGSRNWCEWGKRGNYIAMHEGIRSALVEKGIPDEKIFVIPNGVTLPAKTASTQNSMKVVYVGNFTQGAEHKAFDIIIKAWSIVHQRLPSAKLIMVGGGDYECWEMMAEDLGCGSSITFEGPQQDVDAYYSSATIHILPSRKEGLSNALLEAQSHGLASVVSDIPGNRAVVRHGVNGLIVPVSDVAGFATALEGMLCDHEGCQRMGKNSRRIMEEHFSIQAIVDQLLTCYKRSL